MPVPQIKNLLSFKKFAAIIILGLLISVKLTGVLSAQSVTKGYGSDQVMQRGMIVGVKETDPNKVEAISIDQLNRILGVVVNPNDSPITISSDSHHIFVSFTGRYEVLVSDQEGAISPNDFITVSSISGIGMRATVDQDTIIGRATGNFDGKSNVISTMSLKNKGGQDREVRIGRVPVELAIGKNPLAKNIDNTPAFLRAVGNAIAGKEVSAVRLYLGAAIFSIGTIVAGAILYAGISSGIISIGRNPLIRKSIFKSVLGVAVTSLLVFLISVLGVYLLLKL